jgi:hypothetical protein
MGIIDLTKYTLWDNLRAHALARARVCARTRTRTRTHTHPTPETPPRTLATTIDRVLQLLHARRVRHAAGWHHGPGSVQGRGGHPRGDGAVLPDPGRLPRRVWRPGDDREGGCDMLVCKGPSHGHWDCEWVLAYGTALPRAPPENHTPTPKPTTHRSAPTSRTTNARGSSARA